MSAEWWKSSFDDRRWVEFAEENLVPGAHVEWLYPDKTVIKGMFGDRIELNRPRPNESDELRIVCRLEAKSCGATAGDSLGLQSEVSGLAASESRSDGRRLHGVCTCRRSAAVRVHWTTSAD